MRRLLYGVLAAAVLTACGAGDGQGRNPGARHLYEKSVQLLNAYIYRMSVAKDSASVHKLDSAYDSAVTRLNFAYSPDAVLEISESENDTLTQMTVKFAALRDSLLYRFAHPLVLAADSLATDSAKAASPALPAKTPAPKTSPAKTSPAKPAPQVKP